MEGVDGWMQPAVRVFSVAQHVSCAHQQVGVCTRLPQKTARHLLVRSPNHAPLHLSHKRHEPDRGWVLSHQLAAAYSQAKGEWGCRPRPLSGDLQSDPDCTQRHCTMQRKNMNATLPLLSTRTSLAETTSPLFCILRDPRNWDRKTMPLHAARHWPAGSQGRCAAHKAHSPRPRHRTPCTWMTCPDTM